MAGEYIRHDDGTYQVVHPSTGVPLGERMTIQQMTELEQYQGSTPNPIGTAAGKGNVEQRNRAKLKQVSEDLDLTEKLQDPEYKRRYNMYNTGVGMPGADIPGFIKTTGMKGLRGLDEMATGVDRLIDSFMWNITDPSATRDEYIQNEFDRQAHSKVMDEFGFVFDDATDMSTDLIGGGLPYFATGQLEVPIARALTGSAGKLLSGPISRAAANTANAPIGTFKRSVQSKARQLNEKMSRPDPYAPTWSEEYLGSGIVGLGEGAITETGSGMGALESTSGTHLGRRIGKYGQAATNFRTIEEKEILDKAVQLGKEYMPGVMKGDQERQILEATMRGNPDTVNMMAEADRASARVDNKVVGRALGIDNDEGHSLLNLIPNKMTETRAKFDQLNAAIQGKFSKSGIKRLSDIKNQLIKTQTPDNLLAAQYVDKYLKQMSDWRKSKKVNPRGKSIEGQHFNGQQYQSMEEQLSREIKDAYSKNNTSVAKSLEKVREELNLGVVNGSLPIHGRRYVEEWGKAKEDFALIKMIEKEGLDVDGNLNMDSVHRHLLSTDPRYLHDTGGTRLSDLYNISKAEWMKGNRQGAGLGSKQIDDYGVGREEHNLMSRQAQREPTLRQKARLGAYRAGSPDIGWQAGGTTEAGIAGSAAMQEYAPHANAVNDLRDIAQSIKEDFDEFMADDEPTLNQNGATQ